MKQRFNSLRYRLLLAASVVLVVFLSLTGFILDRAYEQSAKVNQVSRLETNIYDLFRIADPTASSTLVIAPDATDRRLMQPHSGLYAQVTNQAGQIIWTSPSMVGEQIAFHQRLAPAEQHFYELDQHADEPLFAMSMGVMWEDEEGRERFYTFSVAENQAYFIAQVDEFRHSLWFWLGGLVIVLLLVQWAILDWGLTPLRRLAKELLDIEDGVRTKLDDNYPQDLQAVTHNLNELIVHERRRQERYRHAMADLAHSLKTPLAVLRSLVQNRQIHENAYLAIEEQVERLDQITRYQLQRAATSGKSKFAQPVPIEDCINKIIAALQKVYFEKKVLIEKIIDYDCVFYGDINDLMEVLGNLLDNACKYGNGYVQLKAKMRLNVESLVVGLSIEVKDNGPGIPAEAVNQVLERGVRLDSKQEGQGIGLAMCSDIVTAYEGDIRIRFPVSGGSAIEVFFPR